MSLTSLNAYRNGGPISGKLKDLWRGVRRKADDPSWGYIGASMMPGIGEATDLVEIGAGIQDRDLGRIAFGLGSLALPFVAAPALRKMMGKKAKVRPRVTKWDERLRNRHVLKDFWRSDRTVTSNDLRQILRGRGAPDPGFTEGIESRLQAGGRGLRGLAEALVEGVPRVPRPFARTKLRKQGQALIDNAFQDARKFVDSLIDDATKDIDEANEWLRTTTEYRQQRHAAGLEDWVDDPDILVHKWKAYPEDDHGWVIKNPRSGLYESTKSFSQEEAVQEIIKNSTAEIERLKLQKMRLEPVDGIGASWNPKDPAQSTMSRGLDPLNLHRPAERGLGEELTLGDYLIEEIETPLEDLGVYATDWTGPDIVSDHKDALTKSTEKVYAFMDDFAVMGRADDPSLALLAVGTGNAKPRPFKTRVRQPIRILKEAVSTGDRPPAFGAGEAPSGESMVEFLDADDLNYGPSKRFRDLFEEKGLSHFPEATTQSIDVRQPYNTSEMLRDITKERAEWLKPMFPEAPWDLVENYDHPLRANFIEDLTAELGHRPNKREQYKKIGELALDRAGMEGNVPDADDVTSALRAINEVTRSTADPRLLSFDVTGPHRDKGKFGKDFIRGAAKDIITDYRNLGADILGVAGHRVTGARKGRQLLQAATGRRGYMGGEPLRYTWGGAPVQDRGLQYLLNALPIAEGRVFDPVSHVARAGVGYGREFGLTGNALREDQGNAPSPPMLPRLPQTLETPEELERRRIQELLRQRVPPPTFRPIN